MYENVAKMGEFTDRQVLKSCTELLNIGAATLLSYTMFQITTLPPAGRVPFPSKGSRTTDALEPTDYHQYVIFFLEDQDTKCTSKSLGDVFK